MNQKQCLSCNAHNAVNAKFCSECGTEFQAEKKQESKKTKTEQKSNSFLWLFAAFLFAIVTIFLVLDSNRKTVEINTANTAVQSPEQQAQMNQMMEGIQKIKRELDQNPNDYKLNVQMGNNYFDIGRFPQAIQHYKRALNQDGSDPNVLIDIGVAYFNTNNSDSALYFMNNALKINPDHAQGLYNIGIVHFNRGDSATAIQNWEKLVQIHKDSPQADAAKKFIDQIKNKQNNS